MCKSGFSRVFLCSVAITLAGVSSASAEFLSGQEMQLDGVFFGAVAEGYTHVFTVDSASGAVEVPNWGNAGFMSVDVFDTGPSTASVLFTPTIGILFSQFDIFAFLTALGSGIPDILSVSIGDASTALNDPSRVGFTANTLSYNFGRNLSVGPGDFVRLDLTFEGSSEPVPEPATLVMLAMGGLALLVWRRSGARHKIVAV